MTKFNHEIRLIVKNNTTLKGRVYKNFIRPAHVTGPSVSARTQAAVERKTVIGLRDLLVPARELPGSKSCCSFCWKSAKKHVDGSMV